MTAESGREAAVEHLGDVEHCRDLAGKFARESAWRTGDAISSVRDRYETIVEELLAARYVQRDGRRYSLSRVLLSECGTDKALKEFLQHLGRWIKRFALRYYVYELPHNTWVMPGSDVRAIRTLRGRSVSESMMKALAVEHERDPEALKGFLSAVFKRWRKILADGAAWLVHMAVQQVAGEYRRDGTRIFDHLQKIGLAPKNVTALEQDKWLGRIRQNLSRDQREAVAKRSQQPKRPVTERR